MTPGTQASDETDLRDLTVVRNNVYFSGYDPALNEAVLWQTNGTAAGTSVVGNGLVADSPLAYGNDLYFSTQNAFTGQYDFWETDGTSQDTVKLFSTATQLTPDLVFNGKLYLFDSTGNAYAWDFAGAAPAALATSDGAVGGITGMVAAGSNLFLYGADGLFTTDGTTTQQISTAPPSVNGAVAIGSELYFYDDSFDSTVSGLWKSDGTDAGTVRIESFSGINNLTAAGSQLFFTYYDAGSGLWTSNGSAAGTLELTPTTGELEAPESLVADGSELSFIGYDQSTGVTGLWKTDGTNAGTVQVTPDDLAVQVNSDGLSLGVINGDVYFWATDASGDLGLYKSDGTANGTTEVVSATGLFTSANYAPPVAVGNDLYFGAYDATNGGTIWRTDGTQAGTIPLAQDVAPNGSQFSQFVTETAAAAPPVTGLAIDGYIAGASVFADANDDGIWEPGEAETTTNASGQFSLQGGSGPLVLVGGVDTSTHLAFTGVLEAPSGYTVITPLTTLVQALLPADPSASDLQTAEQDVLSAFGITLTSGESLGTLDPIAGTLAGDPGAEATFVADSEVYDAIDMLSAALVASGTTQAHASQAVVAAIAGEISANPGQSLDLSDQNTIAQILAPADATVDPPNLGPLGNALISEIANVVASSNIQLVQDVQSAQDPATALRDGTAVEIVAQGGTAPALDDETPIDLTTASYTGYALTSAINNAADDIACYCRGTLILTDRGEMPVENLDIGDMWRPVGRVMRPIRWIGRRGYGGRFVTGPKTTSCRSASRPARSTRTCRGATSWISPQHAMYLDGVLIEAKDLLNGVSIVQAERIDKIEYFHIELETHDMIIAEGALSESFIDDDSRGIFHNAHEFSRALPGCAAGDGPILRTAAQRRLRGRSRAPADRGACRPVRPAHRSPLRGCVEMIAGCRIAGWARIAEHPEAPQCLDIVAGGRLIGQVLANRYRTDLERAGLGSGRHAFVFEPPAGRSFALDDVEIRRSLDGESLKMLRPRRLCTPGVTAATTTAAAGAA